MLAELVEARAALDLALRQAHGTYSSRLSTRAAPCSLSLSSQGDAGAESDGHPDQHRHGALGARSHEEWEDRSRESSKEGKPRRRDREAGIGPAPQDQPARDDSEG